ncbi:MAG: hypothetical protein RI898_203, partial [Actinomycetota bacterium]
AVVAGRTASDVVYNLLSIIIMSLAGFAVGWRIRGSILDAVVAYLLLLFFSYSFSWVMACLGLLVPAPEVVNNATFIVLFPLTFIANTFVPSDSLPGILKPIAEWNPVLKPIAEWNPVSTLTHAVRVRFGNLPAETPEPTSWPLQNAMLYSLGWAILLIVIFAPIATRLYQRTGKR